MAAKKRKDEEPAVMDGPVLFVRVDRRLGEAVDQEVERRRAAAPRGTTLSKSDVVRALLWKALDGGEQARAAG